MHIRLQLFGVLLAILWACAIVPAQSTPGQLPSTAMPTITSVPPGAQASPDFNADTATDAYLALIPAEAKARSDAYFEGGYWLTLWDFVVLAAAMLLLLYLGWSAGMRNLAERVTRFMPLQTLIYLFEFTVAATVLIFPLTVYEEYFREHQYGLATQTFGPWMGDQLKSLLINMVLGGIFGVVLFGVVRRLQRSWWLWGAGVSIVFVVLVVLISPVYLVPIFNKVTRLDDPKVTQPILRLARANGIPAKDVFEIDASRQTTRMSADVSGFGSTMRITMNDNLLKRGSPEEIQAVMGHEMGHYVLHHVYSGIFFFSVVIVILFAFLRWGIDASVKHWGEKWKIRGIGDPAVTPLAVLLVAIFIFVMTPALNSFTRMQEHEADMFGLNASRQPDGMAQAAIHLGEYRKMSPGTIEEWIFFDHPSGRHRIHDSMVWKAENLNVAQPQSSSTP